MSLLLANLIVLIAGFIQASTGIGFAMIAVPLLALLDWSYVPGPVLVLLVVLGGIMVLQERAHVDWRGLPMLLPGMVIGTALAVWFMQFIDPSRFGLLFGIVLLLALGIMIWGRFAMPGALALMGGGFASGFMGTVSGIHGPPLAALYQGASLLTSRSTIALIFVLAGTTALLSLASQELFDGDGLLRGFSMLPGLVAGYGLAKLSHQRLPLSWVRLAMMILVGSSALILIIKAVA